MSKNFGRAKPQVAADVNVRDDKMKACIAVQRRGESGHHISVNNI